MTALNAPPKLTKSKTEWLKFGEIKQSYFIGKEYFAVRGGCHLLCIHLSTGKEYILRANDSKIGDGISCFVGHKSLPFFAYAEYCKNPRVMVMSCPEFKTITTMRSKADDYINMCFSEGELFIALRGFPSCTLEVWKWRTGEFLTTAESKLIFTKQHLKDNYGIPVVIAQMVKRTQQCLVWNFSMCGKKCIPYKEKVTFRDPENYNYFSAATWTHDGLFFLDIMGHAYLMSQDYKLDLVITWEHTGIANPTISTYLGGFIIQGSDGEMKCFKKSADTYKVKWSLTPKHSFKIIISDFDRCVIGVNKLEELLRLDEETKTFKLMRSDEGGISDFRLIYPLCDYLVTLAHNRKVATWDINDGKSVDIKEFDDKVLCIASNPLYCYISLGQVTGRMLLYSCFDGMLEEMCSILLCRNPITYIRFAEKGKMIVCANMNTGEFFIIEGIPGGKFEVLTTFNANHQIADFLLIGAKSCLRLFAIYVTSNIFLAGNCIHRFCIIRNGETTIKKYEIENAKRYYTRLYEYADHPNRDRVFYGVPMDTKNIHLLETKRGDSHARIINRYQSGHLMKLIRWYFDDFYAISYSYGGLIIVRTQNLEAITHHIMPHHRQAAGCKRAAIDYRGIHILSMGVEGLLVCSKFANHTLKQTEDVIARRYKLCLQLFTRPTLGFTPHGIYEGLSWVEYKKLRKTEAERIKYGHIRQKLLKELSKIKEQVSGLLNQNLEGPENEYLDLQEFNLNLVLKEEQIKSSKDLCERTKMHLEQMIQEHNRISNLMMSMFWNTIKEPRKNMWAIYANFDVQSYCVLMPDAEETERVRRIKEYRFLEEMCAANDSFHPWQTYNEKELESLLKKTPSLTQFERKSSSYPSPTIDEEEEEQLTPEQIQEAHEKLEAELEHYTAFMGTTIHDFVEPVGGHYSQFETRSFYQHHWEINLSIHDQEEIRQFFNKKFDNVLQLKIREMGQIIEKNARLRYVLSELNYFSVEKCDIEIIDPEWKQDETPELLTKVDNSEVTISPYISPSEQSILNAQAAEAERIRLALLADDFKERALMAMMNGVLEIRWEDELRKDVPLPKCMKEKDPETFNEEDLRAIRDYEEKVAFLISERIRYKGILTAEYKKVAAQLREGVIKFNERLQECLLLKIKVESACMQEMLKINRMRQMEISRKKADEAEEETGIAILEIEDKADYIRKIIQTLPENIAEIRSNIEQLQLKEKTLDKGFKKEFLDASSTQIEVLIKLYKKRPKSNIKNMTSTCILNEMAKCLLNHEMSILLNSDAIEFLKAMNVLDKFAGIPALIDEHLYTTLCRQRRARIELEIKMKALQLELIEAEGTMTLYEKAESHTRDEYTELITKLNDIRFNRLHHTINVELQIVLKEGFVEIQRTGSNDDFKDAIMVSRQCVNDINQVILNAGRAKLRAMRNAMAFKRGILMMEWEHRRRKMHIVDLQNCILDINSVKVTKEIQSFLKARKNGQIADKTLAFDHEIETLKARFYRDIQEKKRKVMDIENRIETIQSDNRRLDRDIKKINVDVNEFKLNYDETLTEKEKKLLNIKMSSHVKRGKLVNQIQANHNEILVLQAELELLRLKTFPILDYKVEV